MKGHLNSIRDLPKIFWLVVLTHLKNISQNGNLPQIEVKIMNIWNHHLVFPVSFGSNNIEAGPTTDKTEMVLI